MSSCRLDRHDVRTDGHQIVGNSRLDHSREHVDWEPLDFPVALAAAGLGVWQWNLKTNREFWDPTLREMLACDRPEDAETHSPSLFGLLPVTERPRFERTLRQAAAEGRRFEVTICLERPAGGSLPVHLVGSASAVDSDRIVAFCRPCDEPTRTLHVAAELLPRKLAAELDSEKLPFGLFIADAAGRYVEVNRAACLITGFRETELLRKSIVDMLPAESRDVGLAAFQQLQRTGAFEGVLPFVGQGGRRGWWSISAVKLSESRLAGFVLDVTARKDAEEALRRERDLYFQLVDTAPLIILLIDMEGRIQRFNRFMEELTGYRLDEVQGKDWFTTFLPLRDRNRIRDLFDSAVTGMPTRENRNPIVTRSGEERLIEWSDCRLRDDNGNLVGLLAVGQDVTARNEIEQSLRLKDNAIAASINAIAFADLEGLLTYVNPAFLSMWGYDNADQVIGRSALHFWEHPERAAEVMEHLLDGGKWFGCMTAARRDGTLFEAQLSGTLIRGSDGQPIQMMSSFIDVTERLKAEEQRSASEAKFRAIFDAEPECVKVLDDAGRLLEINPAGLAMIGADSIDTLRHCDLLELVMPEYRDEYRDGITRALAGESVRQEFEFMSLSGMRRWAEQYTVPLSGPSGPNGVPQILAVTRDTTQRKQAEFATAVAHHRLRSILDSLYGFVGVYSLDGTLVDANRAPLEAAGLTLDQVLGKPFWETYWWSYSAAVQMKLREALRRAAQGEVVRYETPVRVKGDVLITIDVIFGPLYDEHGAIVNTIGFAVDVTDRTRAENKLRETVDSLAEAQRLAHLGSWNWDIKSDMISWSDETFRIFGYEPQSFVPRYEFEFLSAVHPDDRSAVAAAVNNSLRLGGQYAIDHRIVHPDGSEHFVRELGSVEYDAEGRPARMYGTVQDTTASKLLEKQMQVLQSQLAHAGRIATMGEMAAGIAHELNQPLAAINLLAEGCAAGVSDGDIEEGELKQRLGEISALASGCGEIIRRLRRLAAKQKSSRSTVDVRELIKAVVPIVENDARLFEIPIVVDLPGEPLWVQVDAVQIQQVLLNLLRNAIEAHTDYHVSSRIEIGVRQVGEQIEIRVSDRGCGIGPDAISRIFEPFFTTKATGLGLGLKISQTITQAHGGVIRCISDVAHGTTLTVSLPMVQRSA